MQRYTKLQASLAAADDTNMSLHKQCKKRSQASPTAFIAGHCSAGQELMATPACYTSLKIAHNHRPSDQWQLFSHLAPRIPNGNHPNR